MHALLQEEGLTLTQLAKRGFDYLLTDTPDLEG